ncbi:DUF1761 domain-containing protein [Amycolatopsis sp. CA-230715]|uniref:DUF1761 domain-containing protein n=1 Tax=Amycolatopsis sp. CA-230715 TaxID=2745196 RepID=UPI001C02545D|nr:DUF1761 domain-containing protein [Amycolatopsis sp. CA-230715]QWF78482.1 hypothetical protein HUW46_01878 [Amycolatopsis sp. CA-230715]
MAGINVFAVLVSTVVAFVVSSTWYAVFGARRAALLAGGEVSEVDLTRPAPGKMLVELVRTTVLALVFAVFVAQFAVGGVGGALVLALVSWVAFPGVLLSGSVLWDGVPWRLAVIHGGDWLLKLLALALIIGAWR